MMFSVITPVKNSLCDLKKTIQSVAMQEEVSYEHIIIDSKSTDGTKQYMEKIVIDNNIIYIYESDSSISEAFNKGVSHSNGTWVLFLGAGDELFNQTILSDISLSLDDRIAKPIVWGNINLVDSHGQIVRQVSGRKKQVLLKRYMSIPHQAIFHNRKILGERFIFLDKYQKAMDYELVLNIAEELTDGCFIDYCISNMLIGGVSQNGFGAMAEFRDIQIEKHIWNTPTAFAIYYYARLKKVLKSLLMLYLS